MTLETNDAGMGLGEGAYRAAPRDQWQYDPRLMTPDRLLKLASQRPVRVQRDERGLVVVCGECEGQVMPLKPSPMRGRTRAQDMTPQERARAAAEFAVWGPACTLDLPQLLADTVRHGVMVHNDCLSGRDDG
jgi:hypothetical protein